MQMRRIDFDDLSRGLLRVVNGECAALIGGPLGWGDVARVGVSPTKVRPPFCLKPLVPSLGVRRANGESTNAIIICDDQRQRGFKNGIGRGIDVTHQPAIFIKV